MDWRDEPFIKPNQQKEKAMKSQDTVQNTLPASKSGRVFQYARRVALSTPGKLLLAGLVIFSLVSIPLLTKADERNEERTLTGNWLVTSTRIDPLPGQTLTFLGLATFFEDGNYLEENNEAVIRSTARGHWERIGHQQFVNSFIFFRFDAARNYLGTVRPTTTITLSDDGSEYQGDTVVQIYDVAGNLVRTTRVTGVAHRL